MLAIAERRVFLFKKPRPKRNGAQTSPPLALPVQK
jgi:hypothetical protein